jgi:peptidyl-prolyl cis-trans isomerase B (cyclophilin B)
LLGTSCTKSGNNKKAAEEGKVMKSDDPNSVASKLTEPEVTETKSQDILEGKNPIVLIETSMGNIKVELFQEDAPVTVKNFLDYVNENFYDGTIFHRVVPNFVIQGGGFTENMTKKTTRAAIKNEATNGFNNIKGTVAMARTSIINSATSQFFINLRDNLFLDHKDESPQGYGYCVFGQVIDGMNVVESIGRVPREKKGRYENIPVKPVIIKSIRVL